MDKASHIIVRTIGWVLAGLLVLGVMAAFLAMGLGVVFAWLSPVGLALLFFFSVRVVRALRRRRGIMALSYVEQAVRLNLPLPQMLQAAELSEGPTMFNRLARVRYRLVQGFSVADALSDGVPELPLRAVAAVGAAEGVGRLRQGLRRALDEQRAAAARTVGVIEAFGAYPLFMILMISLITSMLAIFVMPKFEQIFKDFGLALPPLSIRTIRLAASLGPVVLIVSALLALGLAAVVLWEAVHLRSLRFASSLGVLDRLWWSLPFYHGMQRDQGLAAVSALMADACDAGMPAGKALAEASRLRVNRVLRDRIWDWASRVHAGEALGAAAAAARMPPLLSSMLNTAHGPDATRDVFQFLARYYRSRFSRGALLVEAALVPVTVLIFAVAVTCIALSLFLPLIELTEHLNTMPGMM